MALRMRKVIAIPRVGVRVYHLLHCSLMEVYNLVPVPCTVCYRRERGQLQETLPSVTLLVQLVSQHRNVRFLVVARLVAQISN